MRPANRKDLAWCSLLALLALWFALFAALGLSTDVAGADSPGRWWVLLWGCLLIMLGLHFIYFRHEDAELGRERAEQWWHWWPPPDFFTPGTTVLFGIVCIIFGLVLVAPIMYWFIGGE